MGKRSKHDRQVRVAEKPTAGRTPHAGVVPSDAADRIVWRFARIDLDGKWGWRNFDSSQLDHVLEKLKHFEGMKINELFGKGGNKRVPAKNICPEAQARLSEIEADDLDELWELRLKGKIRVWGTRSGHIYQLLWWDPNHTVCPSALRNT